MLTVWMIRPVIASFVSLAALLLLAVSAVATLFEYPVWETESTGALSDKNFSFSISVIIADGSLTVWRLAFTRSGFYPVSELKN